MIDHPQFEYYNKRELFLDNADDLKLLTDIFCAKYGDTINGKVVEEARMHK